MNIRDKNLMEECVRQVSLYKALTGGNEGWREEKLWAKCPLSEEEIGAWLREQMQKSGIILSNYARLVSREKEIPYKRLRRARKAIGAVAYGWIDADTLCCYWFWKLPEERKEELK